MITIIMVIIHGQMGAGVDPHGPFWTLPQGKEKGP